MKKYILFVMMLLLCQTIFQAQSLYRSEIKRYKSYFAVTDIGYSVPFNRGSTAGIITTEWGVMKNLNSDYAIGSSLLLTLGHKDLHLYFKVRAKKWLTDNMSIDFSPGIVIDAGNHAKKGSFTASMDLYITNWFAITTQMEPVSGYQEPSYCFSGGVKLSSKPGLIVNIVATLVGIAAAVAFFSSWDGPFGV